MLKLLENHVRNVFLFCFVFSIFLFLGNIFEILTKKCQINFFGKKSMFFLPFLVKIFENIA